MTIRALCVVVVALSGPAAAQPVYKDADRFGPPRPGEAADGGWAPPGEPGAPSHGRRPARTVTGDPGYVGSDYGLGRPAFTGLGSRPDWGRSE